MKENMIFLWLVLLWIPSIDSVVNEYGKVSKMICNPILEKQKINLSLTISILISD